MTCNREIASRNITLYYTDTACSRTPVCSYELCSSIHLSLPRMRAIAVRKHLRTITVRFVQWCRSVPRKSKTIADALHQRACFPCSSHLILSFHAGNTPTARSSCSPSNQQKKKFGLTPPFSPSSYALIYTSSTLNSLQTFVFTITCLRSNPKN
ncbi:LANO_0H08790g1_1 [Lachancea nothofagi CBS 11611]|uniref:LANO_0H08790g1_1 n=1 Tax=Lachancea nothofagi CBS 11611 TaxID=1266666 RepID=A0A1G4KLX7_9SACH|nr:LANO_0H08790g1_1 [Lachancea nothofagi CBS 11611]